MSSSTTETTRRRDDAPDGRLGLRGHDRRVAQAGRRLGRVRGDDLRDLDRQDRHRVPVARRGPRWRRSSSRSARRSTSARCSRGSRPTPSRARRTLRGRAAAAAATSEAAAATGDAPAPTSPTPAPSHAPQRQRQQRATRRSSADRRRARRRPRRRSQGTGRGGRVRKKDVLAFLENGGGAARSPSRRCTSSRPTGPTRRRPRRPRRPRRAGEAQPLSRMRRRSAST